jgi:hypothetical protein
MLGLPLLGPEKGPDARRTDVLMVNGDRAVI